MVVVHCASRPRALKPGGFDVSPALHVLLFGDARGAHNAVGHKLAVLLAAAVLLCFEDEAVGLFSRGRL